MFGKYFFAIVLLLVLVMQLLNVLVDFGNMSLWARVTIGFAIGLGFSPVMIYLVRRSDRRRQQEIEHMVDCQRRSQGR